MWLQSTHMQGLGSTASHTTLQLCKPSPPPPPSECAVTQSMQNSFSRGQFGIPRLYGSALGRRRQRRRVPPVCVFPLTEDNVERVLDEVRPSLMADGGNVALHEIDGLVVVLKLQGACGSCPSSTMTLKMGIETRLRDKIPEIEAVEQILDTETGLELNEENVENIPDQSMLTVCLLYVVGGEYRRSHFGPCGDKTVPCWNRRWSARARSDQWLHFEGSTEWTCSWGYDGSRGVDAEIER